MTTDQLLWGLARDRDRDRLPQTANEQRAVAVGPPPGVPGVCAGVSACGSERNGLQRSGRVSDHVGHSGGAADADPGEAVGRPPPRLKAPSEGPPLLPPDPTPNRHTRPGVNQKKT